MWNISLPTARWYDINTPGLGEFIETLDKYDTIAIDTETTGLNVMKDFPLFWSLAYGPPGRVERICLSANTLPAFAPLFKKPNRRWIFANAKFDAHMLANVGIQVEGHLVDTQVMHALLFEEFPHGLKDMAKQILGWKWSDFFDTFGKPSKTVTAGDLLMRVFNEAPEKLIDYASNDTYGTLEIFYKLDEMLCDAMTISTLYPSRSMYLADLFYETEMPFTKVLWKCEREGLRVDVERLKAMEGPMMREMDDYRTAMWKIYGGEFNPNSAAQLREHFYNRMNYPVMKKTKGGKSGAPTASVDAEVLKRIADEYNDELAVYTLKYRELAKLHNTYVIGLGDCIDRNGRIHTRFNQDIARCMPAGELVLMQYGYVPVEHVEVGDWVLSHTGTPRRVINKSLHTPTEIYRVTLANGFHLRTNGNHPYRTGTGWTCAKELELGQLVTVLSGDLENHAVAMQASFVDSPVVSIDIEPPEETYGLEVEVDHSHVTGGIVTHNTGRLSSSGPNLQNIPRHREGMYDLRSAFIPGPGLRMIVADYEALEMRILADQAGEHDMIDIFLKGQDIHAGNGSLVFGYPYGDIMRAKDMNDADWAELKTNDRNAYDYLKLCKTARGDAKTVCFGLNYGMQAFNLSKKLKCSVEEAKKKMEQYLERYPSVRNFFEQAVQIVYDTGFAFTYLGRRRTLTDINADSKFLRNRAERQASNLPIQGCLPASTKILTDSGYVPIGEAPEHGTVWTGTSWKTYTKLNRGECELAELELGNGQTLTCDTRHEVLTLTGEEYTFKKWKDLKVGDNICMSLATPLDFGLDYVDTLHLYWMGFAYGNMLINEDGTVDMLFSDKAWHYTMEDKEQAFIDYCTQVKAIRVSDLIPLWTRHGFDSSFESIPNVLWRTSLRGRLAFVMGLLHSNATSKFSPGKSPHISIQHENMLNQLLILLRTVGIEAKSTMNAEGHVLILNRRQVSSVTGFGITCRQYQLKMPSPASVVKAVTSNKYNSCSHKSIRSRVRRTKVIGPYTARDLLSATRKRITMPEIYAVYPLKAKKALEVYETTYTLSVDSPLHRFDSEGVISKNSAADVAKMAMLRCDQSDLRSYGWKMLSQVHDELIFEGPPETTQEAMRTVTECMEHPFDIDLKVPLVISIKDGNSWAEAK